MFEQCQKQRRDLIRNEWKWKFSISLPTDSYRSIYVSCCSHAEDWTLWYAGFWVHALVVNKRYVGHCHPTHSIGASFLFAKHLEIRHMEMQSWLLKFTSFCFHASEAQIFMSRFPIISSQLQLIGHQIYKFGTCLRWSCDFNCFCWLAHYLSRYELGLMWVGIVCWFWYACVWLW